MKKKKGPLILICVLVLLLILYFVLSTWNKKQDSKEEETVKVTDLKTSKITGVKYDLGTGEMNFEKDGDTWYYTADKDFPLRQSYPKTVADAMGQLNADRELEDADALKEYGLYHPTYTVTLTDEAGTMTTIKVGNATGNDYLYGITEMIIMRQWTIRKRFIQFRRLHWMISRQNWIRSLSWILIQVSEVET